VIAAGILVLAALLVAGAMVVAAVGRQSEEGRRR
jgi:hypothetical protein